MKNTLKFLSLLLGVVLMFSACDKGKFDELAYSANGVAPVLSASTGTIAPVPPVDDNSVVVTYSWTDSKHATDSAHQKYVVEIDTAGGSFVGTARKTVYGQFNASFTAKEINDMLLAYGIPFGKETDMIIRVSSSYANNNELFRSNIITAKMTPYKVPPKIPVPAGLYIVGDLNGWNNNSGLDKKYYFYKVDETTYEGVFQFTGGGGYKLIQELGNWDTQYRMVVGGKWNEGEFIQQNSDPTFPNPTDAGWYRITVDFQHGTYKVVKTDAQRYSPVPANLYLVGSLNGWNNSGGLDAKYKFTKVDDFLFTIDADFTTGDIYKLIQELGNWDSQFRFVDGGTGTAGEFIQQNSDPAFPSPGAGKFRLTVNFATMKFSAVKL